ncbi:hypothetical protein [Cohnella nanjingensis]|uniref:Uncharacterized protein n=1 Tax=Cohnella nanjingensis TaxID=1387779 RepID=A0A7X0RPC1_9BACL|nr:hypothetical protein [Cohnella nanjingensis]MBB6670051.1 hypothetical protein [Cohnella nanjingensis]
MPEPKNSSMMDTLKVVKDISIALTFSIYFSGFLFVTAKYSVFINDLSPFDIISSSLPTTLDLYLRNGVFVCCTLLISYVVAFYLYTPISNISKGRKKTKKKRIVKLRLSANGAVRSALEMIPPAIVPGIIIELSHYNIYVIHVMFILTFIYLFIWYFRVKAYIISEIEKENAVISEILDTNGVPETQPVSKFNNSLLSVLELKLIRRRISNGTNAYYLMIFLFFTSLFICVYGVSLQKGKLISLSEGVGAYKIANVYYDNSNNYQQFYVLDVSKDLLIGYYNNKASIVPISKISRLDINSVKLKNDIKKLGDIKTANINSDQHEIANTILKYYQLRIIDKDSSELLSVITDDFYQSNYKIHSLDSIAKRWNVNNEYNGHPLNEYIGVELSIPEMLYDGSYEVYVYEMWNKYDDTARYIMTKENGSWKIDHLESNKYSISFE